MDFRRDLFYRFNRDKETYWVSHALHVSRTAKYSGACWLSKRNSYQCYLRPYKSLDRQPGRPRKRRPLSEGLERERRRARDPWLLATSLSPRHRSAKRTVNAYTACTQIEEAFRDLERHRWGYSIQYARSRLTQRLENPLFLTALATIATCLAGLAAKTKGWMKHFQANAVAKHPVLSVFFLARRVLQGYRFKLAANDLNAAMTLLPQLVNTNAQHP
jgi:hypothetical protein